VNLKQIDAKLIAIVALAVSFTALLFGSGIVTNVISALWRFTKWVWGKRREHQTASAKVKDYLTTACVWMDGLPLFFEQTWAWGPSVPNYGAGGRFPDDRPPDHRLKELEGIIRESMKLYSTHSKTGGKPYGYLEEELDVLGEIRDRFWTSLETFVKSYWPLNYPRVIDDLRACRIPELERQRILGLRDQRRPPDAGPAI